MSLIRKHARTQPEHERRQQCPEVRRDEREHDRRRRIRELKAKLPRIEKAIADAQGRHEGPEGDNEHELATAEPERMPCRVASGHGPARLSCVFAHHARLVVAATRGSIPAANDRRQVARDAQMPFVTCTCNSLQIGHLRIQKPLYSDSPRWPRTRMTGAANG